MIRVLSTFLFFTLGIYSSIYAQNRIQAVNVDKSKLPACAKYSGNFYDALRWTDKRGDNLAILSNTGIIADTKFDKENDSRSAQVFGYGYLITDTLQPAWKIYDFENNCMVDVEATFLKNTFQVTDLNNNGIAEVWIMYKTACHGDVSPYAMKIIMYEGTRKFAMRGENKVKISETEYYGGTYKFDNAFADGPKEFREFALKLWNKNILQVW